MARPAVVGQLIIFAALSSAPATLAQEPRSGPLAAQLVAALDAAKLDSVAARDPSAPDAFCAVLYISSGAPLMVVSARYAAPRLLDARIAKKEYRDTYIDLNSASVPGTKLFIQDMGADGLRAKRGEGQAADTFEQAGQTMAFDGDWKKAKQTEQDYFKAFSAADERYSAILTALLAEAKRQP